MVQDKKNFSSGNKSTTETSKNLDNRKGQAHSTDRDSSRPGSMRDQKDRDQNLSRDKDIGSKRDVGSRK